MKRKFKVTFLLMIEPTQGDSTFSKSFTVEAEDEKEALEKAEELKDSKRDPEFGELKYRSVFNQFIKPI